jgi:HEAT repeat protein
VATTAPRPKRLTWALVGISLFFLPTSYFASAKPISDVNSLINQLHDTTPEIRRHAAYVLGGLGPAAKGAIPGLVKLLKDPRLDLQQVAAKALVRLGPVAKDTIPDLVKILKDPDAYVLQVVYVLGGLGPVAKDAIPALVKLLKDPDAHVRVHAAQALGGLGPAAKDTIPELVKLLKDPVPDVRGSAAGVLGGLGPAAKDTIPELVKLLKDPVPDVRGSAAEALGDFGPAAKDAIPSLVRLLKDPEPGVRRSAAEALVQIAENVSDKNQPDATTHRHLNDALKLLESSDDYEGKTYAVTRITRAVNHLKTLEDASLTSRISGWFHTDSLADWKTWAVILPAGWLVFLFAVFLVKPLWLLHWNETLKDQLSIKAKRSDVELSLGIPLGYVSLIKVFAYRRRVLDAWVKAHVERCRENFEKLPTVKDRMVHIPSPVKVDGSLGAGFSAITLRAQIGKSRHQCRWLIFGEGGVGKTSLACQMARWAMAPDKVKRLAPHLVLPVLIEDELDNPATPAGLARFTEAIRGKLQTLTGSPEPISPDLLTHLLRRLRILVIVDHITEMSQATRDQIRFDAPDFPAAALVVTARTDATLGNLPKYTIEPIRIQGTRLSVFIDAYLNERKTRDGFKARELFDDEEYFEACKQLSRMAGERDITVLLAKLYADQMVAAKESPDADELPKTIPDLILRYLSELNRNVGGEDNRVVHRDCKAIAWECLKPTYRPGPAERMDVMEALKGDGDDEHSVEARLKYLIDHLRVIQVTGSAEDHIRFVLDPLAEYLAGLQVVEENQGRGTQKKWEAFLRRADDMPGAPEGIRGFLLAVRDCCLASTNGVPDFVTEELSKRSGLDPEMVQQLQLKQRVRHYIANLGLPNADDRQHAAEVLGELGPAAMTAIPDLVKLLSDLEADVRGAAAEALGEIGPVAEAATVDLFKLLKDTKADVRRSADYALDKLGPPPKAAIPDLIKLLSDPEACVRSAAAAALGRLDPPPEAAAPDLFKLLKDPETDVRRAAAGAIVELGPAAETAIPDLVELLKDPDKLARLTAALALGSLGPSAGAAIPDLAKLLSDPEPHVRQAATFALNQLGPTTGAAIPDLAKLLSEPEA